MIVTQLGMPLANDRLEGSQDEIGGLIIKKKKDDKDVFKKPMVSVLGLQKLAEQKRKDAEKTKKVSRHDSSSESSSDGEDHKKYKSKDSNKHYRSYRPETPSNPGGVSEYAKEKIKRRRERDKEEKRSGVYAETDYKKKKYRDDDRFHEKEKKDRERSEKSKESRRREHESSSRRYAEWEDTPSSRYSDDARKTTPRNRYGNLVLILKNISVINYVEM